MSDPLETAVRLESQFVGALPELAVPGQAVSAPDPELLALNVPLARELGFDPEFLRGDIGRHVLVGRALLAGSSPVAQVYAGHQFGGYSPVLGDGRALLLGEIVDGRGTLRDLHLKGSGPTRLSRGDGFAVVGPMLREYLVSEAMHAMGVPATRALAVTATGRTVRRDSGTLPAAVLTRVAASHLRVGSFEYASYAGDQALLGRLADFAIARHYPDLLGTAQPYLGLLERVIDAQARLTAEWMLRGFVHGVMNTDNVTISGESIDFGPCAFLDRYDPEASFSSIDQHGRYAYGQQPSITRWNLERFAIAILPLLGDDDEAAAIAASGAIDGFDQRYQEYWGRGMRAKLGLSEVSTVSDAEVARLGTALLDVLQLGRLDFTGAFRALSRYARGEASALETLVQQSGVVGAGDAAGAGAGAGSVAGADAVGAGSGAGARAAASPLRDWADSWLTHRPDFDAMDRVNPLYIPRNGLLDAALNSANEGDLSAFYTLLDAVSSPYDPRPGLEAYALPAPLGGPPQRTYCGT